MKTKLFFLAILLVQAFVSAGQSRVVVDISNIRNDRGVCRVCIFSSEASFKSGTALQCAVVGVRSRTAKAEFNNLPPGAYAIFVFHDANSNNKMDKNFLGIPSEGYGASRNDLPFAAAPTFEDNQFNITPGMQTGLRIRLRNL